MGGEGRPVYETKMKMEDPVMDNSEHTKPMSDNDRVAPLHRRANLACIAPVRGEPISYGIRFKAGRGRSSTGNVF